MTASTWRLLKPNAAAAILALLVVCPSGLPQNRDLRLEPISGGRRVALVIGNANYPGHLLANPVHDANDVSGALSRNGFSVRTGKDLTRRAMLDEVSRFTSNLQEGDVALFYFSGHGMEIDGENLLVPTDFPQMVPARAADTKAATVPFDNVQKALEQSKARLSIIVLDACRTSPYRRTERAWDQGGLAPVDAGLGTYVAFSASPGQTADDNSKERNGLFTKFLLNALTQQPPPLSQVFRRVRDDVFQASGQKQRPFLVDQITGDFSFVKMAAPVPVGSPGPQIPPVPPAPPDPILEGLRLYRQGNCPDALKIFDRAVREHPQDPFVQNAAGVTYLCLKQYSLAVPRFDMAIHLQPTFAVAYLNRGTAYSAVGQYELAVENFDWAVEQEPWNGLFLTRRGQANFNLRKYDEALSDFNRAIELNPLDAEAFHGRGQVKERQGHYADAAADYQAALARNANLAAASQDLTRVRARLGR